MRSLKRDRSGFRHLRSATTARRNSICGARAAPVNSRSRATPSSSFPANCRTATARRHGRRLTTILSRHSAKPPPGGGGAIRCPLRAPSPCGSISTRTDRSYFLLPDRFVGVPALPFEFLGQSVNDAVVVFLGAFFIAAGIVGEVEGGPGGFIGGCGRGVGDP